MLRVLLFTFCLLMSMPAYADKTVTDEKGNKVTKYDTGAFFIEKPNGTEITINPDGSRLIEREDGSVEHWTTLEDGWDRIIIDPDGTKHTEERPMGWRRDVNYDYEGPEYEEESWRGEDEARMRVYLELNRTMDWTNLEDKKKSDDHVDPLGAKRLPDDRYRIYLSAANSDQISRLINAAKADYHAKQPKDSRQLNVIILKIVNDFYKANDYGTKQEYIDHQMFKYWSTIKDGVGDTGDPALGIEASKTFEEVLDAWHKKHGYASKKEFIDHKMLIFWNSVEDGIVSHEEGGDRMVLDFEAKEAYRLANFAWYKGNPPPTIAPGTAEDMKAATKADGKSSSWTDNDGTEVTYYKNGTVFKVHPDGSEETINPDGSRLIERPDGTVEHWATDGTIVIKTDYGDDVGIKTTTVETDGTHHIEIANPEGEQIAVGGILTWLDPNKELTNSLKWVGVDEDYIYDELDDITKGLFTEEEYALQVEEWRWVNDYYNNDENKSLGTIIWEIFNTQLKEAKNEKGERLNEQEAAELFQEVMDEYLEENPDALDTASFDEFIWWHDNYKGTGQGKIGGGTKDDGNNLATYIEEFEAVHGEEEDLDILDLQAKRRAERRAEEGRKLTDQEKFEENHQAYLDWLEMHEGEELTAQEETDRRVAKARLEHDLKLGGATKGQLGGVIPGEDTGIDLWIGKTGFDDTDTGLIPDRFVDGTVDPLDKVISFINPFDNSLTPISGYQFQNFVVSTKGYDIPPSDFVIQVPDDIWDQYSQNEFPQSAAKISGKADLLAGVAAIQVKEPPTSSEKLTGAPVIADDPAYFTTYTPAKSATENINSVDRVYGIGFDEGFGPLPALPKANGQVYIFEDNLLFGTSGKPVPQSGKGNGDGDEAMKVTMVTKGNIILNDDFHYRDNSKSEGMPTAPQEDGLGLIPLSPQTDEFVRIDWGNGFRSQFTPDGTITTGIDGEQAISENGIIECTNQNGQPTHAQSQRSYNEPLIKLASIDQRNPLFLNQINPAGRGIFNDGTPTVDILVDNTIAQIIDGVAPFFFDINEFIGTYNIINKTGFLNQLGFTTITITVANPSTGEVQFTPNDPVVPPVIGGVDLENGMFGARVPNPPPNVEIRNGTFTKLPNGSLQIDGLYDDADIAMQGNVSAQK